MKKTSQFFLLLIEFLVPSIYCSESWRWECISEKCIRSKYPEEVPDSCRISLGPLYPSLEVCRLACGQFGGVWPRPTGKARIGSDLTLLNPEQVKFNVKRNHEGLRHFLQEIQHIFQQNIRAECLHRCQGKGKELLITVDIESSEQSLTWDVDESYKLVIDRVPNSGAIHVEIEAKTIFGARHGLETLSQLTASYQVNSNKCGHRAYLVMVQKASIEDKPFYKHRGLMVDTARNYMALETLQKQIDGLAASKMNVLHWHATDSQSFPIKSSKVPQLSKYGAYSPEKVYTFEQIKELMDYAKVRGVRIVMEIDSPSHAGNGWQWGPEEGLGNLAVCVNQVPWRSYCVQPPCGQLNPVNDAVYDVLGKLYSEIIEVAPKSEVFHMGGDELFIPCWNSTEEILKYLHKHRKGRDTNAFLELWSHFLREALKQYDAKAGNQDTKIVLWSSHLTDPEVIRKYVDKKRYIIQTWVPATEDLPGKLLELGYRLIVSTKDAWYLDHGFWGSTRYHNWQDVYNNRIPEDPKVLGGEVCSWSEYVDGHSVDGRIWPRAAAAGERLWSNPMSTHISAQSRFMRHRERLVSRNIKADAVGPRWCYQNEGECP